MGLKSVRGQVLKVGLKSVRGRVLKVGLKSVVLKVSGGGRLRELTPPAGAVGGGWKWV